MKNLIQVGNKVNGTCPITGYANVKTILKVFKANKQVLVRTTFTRLDGTTYGNQTIISFAKWLQLAKKV